ncbi:hypothetical protein B0A48_04710 [Cryoendolithus antarcticus]|uniref:DUF3533 domain-containing protein n=1 Tax=Cryoendolithus antarcticus TaxID=1507870 RepID=A0A1V8TDM9_9PEZI|nr:hypothetical protein B0A48_04710 [Cryoendolithus antarcticus]
MASSRHGDDESQSKKEQESSNSGDGGNSGGNDEDQEKQGPPTPVGFWDSRLNAVRKEAFTKWGITTVVLMVSIMALLSIYWAVFYHVQANMSSLVVYVVDFDGQVAPYDNIGVEPIVGPAIVGLANQMVASSKPTLGFGSMPPSAFKNDPLEVRRAVYNFEAWAALIIMPNATSLLYSAIQNGNASYDPMGACQLVYVQARDETNWSNYLGPTINQFETEATSMVGMMWAKTALQLASNNQTVLQGMSQVPQALSPAIGFSTYNLRPFYPQTSTPAVSIGLIYLIIIAFFSFSFYLPIHFKYLKPEGHPPLKFWQLVIWRWFATMAAYFFLSLAYSLISLAFQINFIGGVPGTGDPTAVTPIEFGNPASYGRGTFIVYWMLNWVGMMALGLACENVAMIVGQPWVALWLIFWVITNVSTSFYDIDLSPHFYYWGYAWPLHQIVEGSRQILFDLHSRLGLNFGILFAWAAVNTAVFPAACYFMRWKSKNGVHEYYR